MSSITNPRNKLVGQVFMATLSLGFFGGGQVGAASTAESSLAKTGTIVLSSVILISIIALALVYSYMDYRRHRKPLVQADPYARQTYTYPHHIKAVTIPLLRYRINISLNKKPSGISKF